MRALFAFFLALTLLLPAHGAEPERPDILFVVTQAAEIKPGRPTGLWLEEFAIPYLRFRELGARVSVVTLKGGKVPIDPRSLPKPDQERAWEPALLALQDTPALSQINTEEFEAIFLPGGHGTMFDLPNNPTLGQTLAAFDADGKIIAAVCHGPAGFVGVVRGDGQPLVKGRKLTGFTNEEERAARLDADMPFLLQTRLESDGALFEAGPNYVSHCVRDELLVTGQNPASSQALAELVVELLREQNFRFE